MRTWMTTSTRFCIAAAAAALLIACSSPGSQDEGDGGPGVSGPGASSGAGPGPAGARCSVTQRGLEVSAGKGMDPAIAWGKGHYGVAWTSLEKDSGDVVFALLDPEGKKVKETPVDVGPGVADQPSVVRTASGYLVLWEVAGAAGGTIRGLYLGEDGAAAGAAFTLGTTQSKQARPSGAPHGADVVVSYQDGTGSTVGLLRSTALQTREPIANGVDPALASAERDIGIVHLVDRQIAFARLSVPLKPPAPVLFRSAPGKANLPRIAAHPDGSFDVVWEDDRAGVGNETIYFTRIGADGKPKSEIQIPPEDGSANIPDVAALGGRSAVAYYQFRDGPSAVFLSLVSPDFSLENEELKLSGKGGRTPRIAVSGDTLGVAYAEKDGPVRLSLVACR